MATRAVPVPVIEYGQIIRKFTVWFACRARRENGRDIPDQLGLTLMYFGNETLLLSYLKGFRAKGIRVDAEALEAARRQFLREDEKERLDDPF